MKDFLIRTEETTHRVGYVRAVNEEAARNLAQALLDDGEDFTSERDSSAETITAIEDQS